MYKTGATITATFREVFEPWLPIITDLQKINPSAIIELFTLETTVALHGSAQTYRFHNGIV